MMMKHLIDLQHLVKKFGDQTVLQDVNLIVNQGEIVGRSVWCRKEEGSQGGRLLNCLLSAAFMLLQRLKLPSRPGSVRELSISYFHSKDDLFRSILTPIIDRVKQDFFTQLDQFDNLDQLVTFAIQNRLAFLRKNIDLVKILLQKILVGQAFISI